MIPDLFHVIWLPQAQAIAQHSLTSYVPDKTHVGVLLFLCIKSVKLYFMKRGCCKAKSTPAFDLI